MHTYELEFDLKESFYVSTINIYYICHILNLMPFKHPYNEEASLLSGDFLLWEVKEVDDGENTAVVYKIKYFDMCRNISTGGIQRLLKGNY